MVLEMKLLLILPLAVHLVSCAAPQQKPSVAAAPAVPAGFVKTADGTLYAADSVPKGAQLATVQAEAPATTPAPASTGGRKKFWTPERRQSLMLGLMAASSVASSYYSAQAASYSAQAASYSALAASNTGRYNTYGYSAYKPISPYSSGFGGFNPYMDDTIRLRHSFGDRWKDQSGNSYKIRQDPFGTSINGDVYRITADDGRAYKATPTFREGQYKLTPMW